MVDQLNVGILRRTLALQERMLAMQDTLANRLRRQDGQAFVEYALVLTLVAVAVALLTQWTAFTSAITGSLQKVIDALNIAGSKPSGG
jgi:Flp pilus assembly pilin Flp